MAITFFLINSCADVTPSGKNVHYIESNEGALDLQNKADILVAKHNCKFLGFVDAKTSWFPPSYSTHENELHAALKNRAAKIDGNVVIANFYIKPAQGIALKCPQEYLDLKI